MNALLLAVSLVAAGSLGFAAPNPAGAPHPAAITGKILVVAPLGDLSQFRAIAVDTLKLVNAGKLSAATARVKALETAWDTAAAKLQAKNASAWGKLDVLLDNVLGELRIDKPTVPACRKALEAFLSAVDSMK